MFRESKKLIIGLIIGTLVAIPSIAYGVSTFLPFQGGTGTNVIPQTGQVLVGTGSGVYTPTTTIPKINATSVTTTNLNVTNCVGCISSSTVFSDISTTNITSTNAFFANLTAGTISGSAVWNAGIIGTQYGGTGQNFSSASGFLKLTNGVASTSSLNSTIGYFTGFTTNSYTGRVVTGSATGYPAVNSICNANFPGAHMCTDEEIILSIANNTSAVFNTNTAWFINGPPGYTANANDCIGFTTGTSANLGPFWDFDATTGGEGYLVNCSVSKQLSCCR